MDENFGTVARQMGKILDQLNKGYYSFYPSETWTPNVNLYETDNSYIVCVDLAGMDKDKIEIEVHQQRLSVKGTRNVPLHQSMPGNNESGSTSGGRARAKVHLMEIDHGAFSRIVELPRDVVAERIKAEYKNGILWIELPKK